MLNWNIQHSEEHLSLPLDEEIKPVHPKGNQSWIFTGRTDAEAEAPILWPPDVKSQLIRKDPVAGKDWWQGEKETTEDKVVGCHHWLNGHEFEQSTGDSKGQESLVCCSSWGHRESDTTWWLNNSTSCLLFLIFICISFFIWLCWVLVAACRIFYFHCGIRNL